jgi:hypothetical protein
MLKVVPVYVMMAENLPPWAQKEINAICRKFVRGKCMVAWPTVCGPTDLGGLGISDLKLARLALQRSWLWLQKTDHNRVWSQLSIKTVPEV